MIPQPSIWQELMTLRNDLLSAKNLIDQSPEVKTSRRLQGAIARCSEIMNRLEQSHSVHAEHAAEAAQKTGSDNVDVAQETSQQTDKCCDG